MRGPGGRGTWPICVLCTSLVCGLMLVAAEAAHASFAVGDATVSESNGSATATFPITREAGLLAPATSLAYATADGSARAPEDYVARSGTLRFPDALLGATQVRDVSITVRGDVIDEPTEAFRLLIGGGGEQITDGEGLGTILDDDPPPAIGVQDAPPVTEGAPGAAAQFSVRLSMPSGRVISVGYATVDGSALAGQDYAARSETLRIPAGSTAAPIAVPIRDDAAPEQSETFGLRLSRPVAAVLTGGVATATILDDDAAATAAGSTARPPAGATLAGGTRLGLMRLRLRRPNSARVDVFCPSPARRCRGRVTLFSRPAARSKIAALRRERKLARRGFSVLGGRTVTVELKLGRSDVRLLRRARRLPVRAFAVADDATGRANARSLNATFVAGRRQ